ncbi:hypothetical protein J3R82DRAFT_5857 [Butyriboletus roseoflavus]|nr:hypothetical protein J3R82DRAFT_5857 [Butyriboletus roseoflavus]
MDSRIIPARLATPRYHLQLSFLQSPEGSGERVLVEDSQKEERQELVSELAGISVTSPALSESDNVLVQGSGRSGSVFFHGDTSPLSAPAGKVIGTRSISFHSPPTTAALHPFSRPTKPMPVANRHYRRSPSFPSQDSFGGPVSQDPAEQFLASAKQFDVPLSDLGETPTQEVIHSPTVPGMTLPDASEHKEFLEGAMREYEAQRANRATSNRRPNILVAATPSNSGEYSGTSQHKDDDFSFRGLEFAGQESRFEFGGSSSFDKMLDRGLADAPDPTPESTHPNETEPAQVDGVVGVEPSTGDGVLTTPLRSSNRRSPPFEWIAPTPSAAVASSNPRSLLRMVNPGNKYRIARMLAGNVESPACVTTGAVTQPSRMEETQPYHTDESTYSNALPPVRPASRQMKMANSRPIRHQPQREDDDDEPEDALDIVPDSEPLRAGPSAQTPGHHRTVTQSPLKKLFRPLSPMSVHGSGDLAPDSLEVEESEADVPLAIELASRNTKRSVAPTEDIAVHGRKPRNTSSAVPEKAPLLALEKQPRRPTSSSMKGRNLRPGPSKSESTEVPTSHPEQDLQGQAFPCREPPSAAVNMPPLGGKRKGPQPLEPLRVCHTSTMCLPATKPVAGKKRSHNSDTESSEDSSRHPTEDEGVMHPRVQKEEEEESADEHDADSPPPPPSKPDTSRKKRRRNEDVNPTRGMSKASTSTRNKRSETPAIATRSVKKLRSEVSSTRGLTVEPATQVFALWKQDGHYYSGVIHSRGLKNKHLVKFDDGTEDEVELKNIRRRELLVGDRVITIQDNVKGVVSDVSHGSLKLEIDNGQAVATVQVGFDDIRIANRTIQSQWKERMIVAENIVTVVKPKPRIDTTPSKQSVTSTTSSKVQRQLVKTGFVVTINPRNEDPMQTKDEAMCAINRHGGLVIEDWSSVFTMEGKHSQSNKRWIATPQDFRWRSEVNLDRVFLLSDDAHQKPKFLLALALGIPCLSFEWLTRGGKFSSDWQPFLLSAGYSDTLGARISQVVDLDWGNCTEHLTDIMASRVPIKLFSRKKVLCIGADLVPLPPSRARRNNPEEASRYVPWIILCMGADKVEAVTDTKQVSPGHMKTFNYIIVKERNLLGSVKVDDDIVVGDVNWVKECLVSSRLSIPELD